MKRVEQPNETQQHVRPLCTFHFVYAGRMVEHFRHTMIYTNTHTVSSTVPVNESSARALRGYTLLVYNARLPGYVVYVYQIFSISDGRCRGNGGRVRELF